MENTDRSKLVQILDKFSESGWDLIAVPSKAYLEGNLEGKDLITAIEQADEQCGSCGCELDELYKQALSMKALF